MTAAPSATDPNAGKPILSGDEADTGATENALLLGIDLGTSRTSISSLTGARKTIESYVGYAKDPISRKHLKADLVYGKHALDNKLSVDLYRPLANGVIQTEGEVGKKNMEAVRDLLAHLVNLVEPGRDDVLYGVVGVPSEASTENKQAIIEATQGILDSVMIVSEPFCVAYALERISDVLVVDIGAGTTDLCRMHGTVPSAEDQISLDIAGDAVDKKLHELIQAEYPDAQITVNMCKQFKEKFSFVSDTRDKVEVMIPVNGKPEPHDITKQLHDSAMILVKPILDSIHKLVASFDPEFQEKIRNNVILSGGGGLLRGLNKAVEDGLERVGGGAVTVVEEPMFAGANGALQLAMDMPREYWQQLK
ncbi:MAG: MamK family actin-like protein [Planctomycetota bacterium]